MVGELASQRSQKAYTAIIFTESQAAIQACSAPERSSGQYISCEKLHGPRLSYRNAAGNIQLYWLPGHEGIRANEGPVTLAKGAATLLAPNTAEELTLIASARRTLRIEVANAWKTEWATTIHGNSLRRLWKEPLKAPMKLYQGLRSAATSVLIQMQTMKIALASYLGTFRAMESTECSCGCGLQDTRHVLIHCKNQAGPQMRHFTQGSRRELDYRAYLTRSDLVPKAVQFILETGLLDQFQTLPTTYRVTKTDLKQPTA